MGGCIKQQIIHYHSESRIPSFFYLCYKVLEIKSDWLIFFMMELLKPTTDAHLNQLLPRTGPSYHAHYAASRSRSALSQGLEKEGCQAPHPSSYLVCMGTRSLVTRSNIRIEASTASRERPFLDSQRASLSGIWSLTFAN